jgi:hypothetical protein
MSEEPFQLGDYSQFGLAAAEAALFSAWEALEKFHEDLVVVVCRGRRLKLAIL